MNKLDRKDTANISVIVPIYNSQQYLKKCVYALLSQTVLPYEIILVNDGSTDGTGLLCDSLSKLDNKIKVFHKQNGGASSARNYGMLHAKGQYIMFADSDDEVADNWCETLWNEIVNNQDKMIIANIDKNILGNIVPDSLIKSKQVMTNRQFLDVFKMNALNQPCNKIYCREIITRYNILFDEALKIGEDLVFNLNYLKFCEGVLLLPQVVYHYHIHENSLCRNYYEEYYKMQKYILMEMEKCLSVFKCEKKVYEQFYQIYYMQILDCLEREAETPYGIYRKYKRMCIILKDENLRKYLSDKQERKQMKGIDLVLKTKNPLIYYMYFKLSCLKHKRKL